MVVGTDLRKELRARGLNPAGGQQTLRERLIEAVASDAMYYVATSEEQENSARSNANPQASNASASNNSPAQQAAPTDEDMPAAGISTSSARVVRPSEGDTQNSNNLLPKRNISRVTKPPGGDSQIDWI